MHGASKTDVREEERERSIPLTALPPTRTHRCFLLWGWQTDPHSTAALRPEPVLEPHAAPLCIPV